MIFLERGIQLASRSVYSLHKTSTREHVLKKAEGWGAKPQGICTELFVLSLNEIRKERVENATALNINIFILIYFLKLNCLNGDMNF